jgi:hypothetical protein
MHGDAAEMLGVDVKHLQTVDHGFGHMLPGNGLGTGPSCDSTREKRWARTTARTRGAILGVLVGYLQSELFEIHFEATRDRPPETWVESLPHLGLLALIHSQRHRSLINWAPSGVMSEFAVADLNVADFPHAQTRHRPHYRDEDVASLSERESSKLQKVPDVMGSDRK